MSKAHYLHASSLLFACAIGTLAASLLGSALVTPWLDLLVLRDPDWIEGIPWLQRFAAMLWFSLKIAAMLGPVFFGLTWLFEPRSLTFWLVLGITSVSPALLVALFFAHIRFDCFANCEPSILHDFILVSSIGASGAAGAWVAWLVRRSCERTVV